MPADQGFVVEWQLADDAGRVVDLSAAEAEVVLPDTVELASIRR
jgi:hypothetical protein